MTASRWTGILLGMVVWTSMAGAETVYKSVDAEGHVTYSSSPPADGEVVDSATIPTASTAGSGDSDGDSRSMTDQLEADRLQREQTRAADQALKKQRAQTEAEPQVVTQAQLDLRCEQARKARIAPLRQAEIDRCKTEGRKDPDHCERYYADYGNGFRNPQGRMVPPMFSDLPECVEAEKAQRARGR